MVMELRLQILLLLIYGLFLARAEVYLNCGTGISPVCYGEKVVLVCVTDIMNGHLNWENGGIGHYYYVNLLQVDEQRTENGINFTLLLRQNHIESSDVLISSAVLQATNDTIIRCSDGNTTNSKDCHIQIKEISQPKWAIPTCTFSEGNVTLFWNPPSVGAECCKGYIVTIDGEQNSSLINNQTHYYTLHLKNESDVTITVHCVDNPGASSVPVLIQPKTDIESVFIEPIDVVNQTLIGRQLVEYLINWKTKKPVQSSKQMIICSPQEIQNATIACISEPQSNSYSIEKDEFGYCCVPKNDEVNVTVNLINEAGFDCTQNASATILASAYKALDECRINGTGPNSTCSTEEPMCSCTTYLVLMIIFIVSCVIMCGGYIACLVVLLQLKKSGSLSFKIKDHQVAIKYTKNDQE